MNRLNWLLIAVVVLAAAVGWKLWSNRMEALPPPEVVEAPEVVPVPKVIPIPEPPPVEAEKLLPEAGAPVEIPEGWYVAAPMVYDKPLTCRVLVYPGLPKYVQPTKFRIVSGEEFLSRRRNLEPSYMEVRITAYPAWSVPFGRRIGDLGTFWVISPLDRERSTMKCT